jgi:hypothetical protein
MLTSKELLEKIVSQLKKRVASLTVSETDKWSSLYQQSGKRFAYYSFAKKSAKISFWCA